MSYDEFETWTWDDYIGQREMRRTLSLHIEAAIKNRRRVPHTFLAGEPGYGKSALAKVISTESYMEFVPFIAPVKPAHMVEMLSAVVRGIFFLDEIHRASQREQETYLPILQEGYYVTPSGDHIDCGGIQVIAATTEPDKVIPPLYDRFELKPTFEPYTADDLRDIVRRMGANINIEFSDETATRLGRATGGTPRMARSLVLAARTLADTDHDVTVEEILRLASVDADGLTRQHVVYLEALHSLGSKAGVDKLQAMLSLPRSTLLSLERLLVERKLISYAGGGRELRSAGYARLREAQAQPSVDTQPATRRPVRI